MVTTRAYTFNDSGTPISGTEQKGNVAIQTGDIDFQDGHPWISGPDESLGYVICGPYNYGLITNGDFSNDNYNFSWGTVNTTDQYSGDACIQYTGGSGGGSNSNTFTSVDTSETYILSLYAITLQRSTGGNLAGGYMGFSCFDKNYTFIDLRNCGGLSNSYLTRELNYGDSYVYISNTNNNWRATGTTYYYRYILFYPPTHPDYSTPYEYTRIGYGSYTIIYNEITDIGGGELRFKLYNSSGVETTFPDIGYPTPTNTPVSNGVAGGTYNYALGTPTYPETWTKYSTAEFTGESRNSAVPFRYGTKYIKFLILKNYNFRTEDPQDHVWALDNIYFSNTKRIY